jgi:hypothetical protein
MKTPNEAIQKRVQSEQYHRRTVVGVYLLGWLAAVLVVAHGFIFDWLLCVKRFHGY